MSRPRIEPGPPRWEASTLEKSHSNNLLIAIAYSEHLQRSARPVENAHDSTFLPKQLSPSSHKNGLGIMDPGSWIRDLES
jgi:hypothetical protein